MRIIDKLAAITGKILMVDPEFISVDAHLINELGLDSFAIVDFILSIENEFPGLDLSDTSIEQIFSLNELAAYLGKKLQVKQA